MPTGQAEHRSFITSITQSARCEVTTDANHGYSTGDYIRFTDLGFCMPIPRGADTINNDLFLIEVTGATTFFIKDIVTDKYIDSSNFVPYVTGGQCNLKTTNFEYEQ